MDYHAMMTGCIVAATLAFVALCLYGIRALMAARRSLAAIESAAGEARETLTAARQGLTRISRAAGEITADVQDKLQAADKLFESVRDAGKFLKSAVAGIRALSGGSSPEWLASIGQWILIHIFGERVTNKDTAKEDGK